MDMRNILATAEVSDMISHYYRLEQKSDQSPHGISKVSHDQNEPVSLPGERLVQAPRSRCVGINMPAQKGVFMPHDVCMLPEGAVGLLLDRCRGIHMVYDDT
jgi:hypothetical protein